MKKHLAVFIVAFALQVYLIFWGAVLFGKIVNPFLFFLVSLSIGLYCLHIIQPIPLIKSGNEKKSNAWLFALFGLLAVICSFEEVRKLFLAFPMPTPNSDVLQQLETQHDRFAHGIFPYSPVEEIPWKPYPVYMPMHWLPIGISKFLGLDFRWCGFHIYALAAALFGYSVGLQKMPLGLKALFAFLPSTVIWVYIFWGSGDLFITIEILIAAYYLILCSGLLIKNNYLIAVGILLCLLSRYTFIFWLPLFGIIFAYNNSFKTTLLFAGAILVVMFVGYVYPFLLEDTQIFSKGIKYHNGCAVDEWRFGFWTSSYGINFGFLIQSIIGDNHNEKGVYINRVIQAIALMTTFIIALISYFKAKVKKNYYHFLLAYLYIFLLVFYCFCPLTYRYYLAVLLAVSISVGALMLSNNKSDEI